jgi:predicted dehydrogenase
MKTKLHDLGACVVGAGFVGPAHVEALRRNGIEVLGLAAASLEEAQTRAASLNIPRAYADLREALADPDIDVVHLAVPNHLHAPYALAALEAGKHVVCEKPLATSTEEARAMVAAARKSGRVAALSYNLRFYPMVREARERVRSGEVGRIFAVHGSYLQDWLQKDSDWNWRLEPERGGELRAVSDIGTHWLDLVESTTGLRVEQVLADLHTVWPTRRRPSGPVETFSGKLGTERALETVSVASEDLAHILLRFEGGARGSLVVSQVAAGRKNSLTFEIDAEKKALAWNAEEPNSLWIGSREGPNMILAKDPSLLSPGARALASYPGGHQEGYADTFRQFFAAVYSYIAAGEYAAPRDFPGFDEGLREALLCDAILASSRRGAWASVGS